MWRRRGLAAGCLVTWLLATQIVLAVPSAEVNLCKCDRVRTLGLHSPPLQGPDVLELQERLARLGFYSGSRDGVYGSALVQAVRKMQGALGLPPTGNVDDSTWQALAMYEIRPAGAAVPPPRGEISILVDIDSLTLVVYSDGVPYKLYPIAIGRPESPTPVGEWVVCEKRAGWHGATGVRWLRLSNPWGSYGIHGTNNPSSIGQMASAGCVRMFNHDITELYEWVDLGTVVVLKEHRTRGSLYSDVKVGAVGQDVVYLQWRLRQLGFDPGRADGVFGDQTAQMVAAWQNYRGLKVTGKVTADLLYLLGLR